VEQRLIDAFTTIARLAADCPTGIPFQKGSDAATDGGAVVNN
jgi:hypothetical protein